jgi:hypothetical protein
MITPTNNLVKLGIGAAHRMRIELADQLFFPVLVNIKNPSQPMSGGYMGNRSGQSMRLTSTGIAGNTGGFGADYSPLEGDPVGTVKTVTSDGAIFTMQRYDGKGIITIEDARINGTVNPSNTQYDYSSTPRYIVKADGIVYDILELRGDEPDPDETAATGPYRHWEFAAEGKPNPAGGTFGTGTYVPGTNAYTPHPDFLPGNITEDMYTRPVGLISFRDKQGASSGAIQEQLQRAQSTLDTMSRLLRSLHQESQTAFANFVVR